MADTVIRYGFLALLAALIVFFAFAAPGFASPQSAVFIFQSVAITGILALGVTATLVVGGFDLSIGSVATSAMMAAAYAMVVLEQNALVAVLFCLAIGALVGLVNGVLVTVLRASAVVVTLGTAAIITMNTTKDGNGRPWSNTMKNRNWNWP